MFSLSQPERGLRTADIRKGLLHLAAGLCFAVSAVYRQHPKRSGNVQIDLQHIHGLLTENPQEFSRILKRC